MDKALETHARLALSACHLQVMTKSGTVTLTADYERRQEISDHIISSMNDGSLCVLRDLKGVPNLVCRGDKILGFYFNCLDKAEPALHIRMQIEHLKAATEYYRSMTQSEDWKNCKED